FDATTEEPVVLPSRVPNLLINGASGIAVGMATNIPPHNLKDIVKALVELSNDPELTNAKLATIVKAPDFPTGCLILNTRKELSQIYQSGKGSVRMRSEWSLEEGQRGKRFIVVSSIPYAVNKSQIVERVANLIVGRKVPQLLDVRDESTDQVRIVLELAPNADAEIAMAYLFKNTPLESNFSVNLTALVPTGEGESVRPELLSLRECLKHFLNFREEVSRRKLNFEKRTLLDRIHILEGLVAIYDKLDEALKIVRKSSGRSDAAEKLRARFKLSEAQSFAVVDMRIYQLSKTNIDEIRAELTEKQKRVKEIEALLQSPKKISEMVRKDLEEIAVKYGDKRRCRLVTENIELEINEADYVVQEDVFAIVTSDGWLKRIRQNNELGSTRLREGDSILNAHPVSTLDSIALVTNLGFVYTIRAADFPSSSGYGDPIQKLLKFRDGEKVIASYAVCAEESKTVPADYPLVLREGDSMVVVSQKGVGYCTKFEGLDSIKRNGKRLVKLRNGDFLAALCAPNKYISFITRSSSALCIQGKEVPEREGVSVGVALIGVRSDDVVIAAFSHSGKISITLVLESGKEKEISSSEIVSGHRALKGNKLLRSGTVTKAFPTPKQAKFF
ncbi:MAG: hypothetical protein KDD42_04540, partial [Bdellovibrionales bacterium]|nr:hypothetical protein [Bdellovibrionales bacterium]